MLIQDDPSGGRPRWPSYPAANAPRRHLALMSTAHVIRSPPLNSSNYYHIYILDNALIRSLFVIGRRNLPFEFGRTFT